MSVAKDSWDLFYEYANHPKRLDWENQVVKDEEFYYSQQWTEKELKDLEARGAPDVVYNRIYPAVKNMSAKVTANKPKPVMTPITRSDVNITEPLSILDTRIWSASHSDLLFDFAVQDSLIRSQGWLMPFFDPSLDDYRGDIRYARIPTLECFVDPLSRDWDYGDSEAIIIAKLTTVKKAKRLYPDRAKQIEDRANLSFTKDHGHTITVNRDIASLGQKERYSRDVLFLGNTAGTGVGDVLIWELERYSKERMPVWKVFSSLGAQAVFNQTEAEQIEQMLYKQGIGSKTVKIYRPYIHRVFSIGEDILLEDEQMSLTNYPMKPIWFEWTGNPFPRSMVGMEEGKQRTLNKCLSIAITNAQVSSTPKLLMRDGSMSGQKTAEDWRTNWASPGSINFYTGDVPPQIVLPLQLSQAWIGLIDSLASQMDHEMGSYPISMGDPSDAPRTYRATLTIAEMGQDKVANFRRLLEHSMAGLAEASQEMLLSYYEWDKVAEIVNDEVEPEFQITPEVWETARQTVKYDVTTSAGSSMPTNRMAKLQLMMELQERGIVLPKHVRQYVDLPNPKKVDEEMDELEAMKSQLTQASDTIKALTQEQTRLTHSLQEADRAVLEAQYKAKLDVMLAQVQGQQMSQDQPDTLAVKQAEIDMDLQKQAMSHQLDLEHQAFLNEIAKEQKEKEK